VLNIHPKSWLADAPKPKETRFAVGMIGQEHAELLLWARAHHVESAYETFVP